ncbi:MAG: peptidylprolyl isomerase [Lautropia sp.]
MRREYAEYRASLAGMKRYTVSYIRIADEADARDALARIRSGADFGRVARERSTHVESAGRDGRLGTFASCRWARDTVAMLDGLDPGRVHPTPVRGTHGWGIYRLDAKAPLEPLSWEAWRTALLAGTFEPECPWVPPVTVSARPASPQGETAAPRGGPRGGVQSR